MSTPTRNHDGRYTIGKRQPNGRCPVFVDGATEPTGYVWTTGHGARPWATEGSDSHPATYPDMNARRWQAAERVVDLVDARKLSATEAEQRRERAGRAPEGWRFASWEEITREGFRRVRLVAQSAYVDPANDGQPDAGERYAVSFRAKPVRLHSVSRHGRVPQLQALYGDFLHVTYEGGPLYAACGNNGIALGALVPVDTPRRTVSAVPCPECGSHDALYAFGARTGCGACVCRALKWVPDDLPFPIADDDPVFNPGDRVALDVVGTDGITDSHYGTVCEWTAYLDGWSAHPAGGVFRNVRVSLPYGSGQSNCVPAKLRKVDQVEDFPAETVEGWRAGAEAVRFDYNADGVAFERRGWVVGFSDGPDGARMLRFTSSPTLPATPYPVAEVFRIGSHAAWCAARSRKRAA
ncbi:hypothetical protein [Streptomyces violaceusniger]|uniref:Uncharacterized protein n=1 Tax=Streptomyces violaceusniger (strain Tu 4113) TaxID=653045 RepID=G2PHP2_STRV4|nr:hypothetical protein [Streptomyces violaceusniger]AEM88843.1 hypothetical protein Strvi_0067 [Streptomyces violaceusniger Tu 4113]